MNGEERLHRGEGGSQLGVTGTDLIHYGATWNPAAKLEAGQESVAVIVCHGMGQQVRYETISAVANALRTEATEEGGQVDPVEVHLSKKNDAFLARAELNWRDAEKVKHCVHAYEAYWAPLTEGKVTYWDTLKFLFGAGWTCFRYSRGKFTRWMFGGPKNLTIGRWGPLLLFVVGHSLGSVLAYDTLNALINLDNVSSDGQKRDVVGRTRAVVTFGSPLDKTAFIFRMQAKSDEDWIREQMTDSVQPLIVSYAEFRPETLTWVNIWSRMDIISGSLDYYDDPAMPPDLPQHVQNMVDPQANIPLKAHVQYWNNELLRKTLYPFVSSPPNTGQLSVRQAVSKAS